MHRPSRQPAQLSSLASISILAAFVAAGSFGVACANGANGSDVITPGSDSSVDTGSDEDTSGADTGTKPDTTPVDTGSAVDSSSGGDSSSDGSSETSTDGATDAPIGDTCATGCPAGFVDLDGNPLTGSCGCEYACTKKGSTDPIDPAYTDDNCDGSDGVVEKCVFVAAGDGDDANTGTRDKPMKTIANAIAKAKTLGSDVCLSGESYNEFVDMESGVSVYGGFDEKNPDFKFRRSDAATTTITHDGTVVQCKKADVDTYLAGVVLHATTPTSVAVGQSTYGVRFGGGSATFYVEFNKINVEAGTDGGDGTAGAAGDPGAKGGDGGGGTSGGSSGGGHGTAPASSCGAKGGDGGDGGYNNSDGSPGSPGTVGSGGSAGSATTKCFSKSSAGGKGGDALTSGPNGSPGSTAPLLGTLSSVGLYTPSAGPSGTDASAGGSGGGGGGGGGGSSTVIGIGFCNSDRGGGGGAGGGGGCGGKGGGGGTGGGASIGIAAASGTLIVKGNDIKVAKGGIGGKGLGGGAGGTGGAGGGAGAGPDDSGAGGIGGYGSQGGNGGPGSGGPGGPSTCVLSTSSASVTFTVGLKENSCVNGGGGAGGAGGANNGMTGAAGPSGASGAQLTL